MVRQVDFLNIKNARTDLTALTNKHRQRIIMRLEEKGCMTVSDLHKSLNLEQSACSLHLKILRKARIVKARRERVNMVYSLDAERIKQILWYSYQLVKAQDII